MIELTRVSYSYPNAQSPALHNLSLTIEQGAFVVVCGPSGAGKSTFLRLLNGLVPHFYGGRFAGTVRVAGRSTLDYQPRDFADLVGFVFQDPEAQFVVDVVEDEIVFAMENLGLPQRLMRRRVEEVLDQLGIAHLRRRRVSSLSGGEQQRVAIAAVLAAQPRALVLDEPTSQLDPHAAEELLTALQKLNDDLGLTIILCEHRLERVLQYADQALYFPNHLAGGSDGIDQGHKQPNGLLPPTALFGPPRQVLAQTALAPPLVQLGRAFGWSPLPLTIKEGRRCARNHQLIPPARLEQPGAVPAPTLIVNHVHFSYGNQEALYDVSLLARPGEVLALMGRNGSGKTTLLKLITGIIKPQRGTLTVLGHDVTGLEVEDIAAIVGYVPQDPHRLLFHDTLRQELEFTLATRHVAPGKRHARQTPSARAWWLADQRSVVDSTLAQLDLAYLSEVYPRDLSGGEAQRAALAAILVGNPPVLLLDEPTRGLDYVAKERLGALLRGLAQQGRTIMLATHDVELVAAYADRVLMLGEGECVVEGPVREVLSDSLIFSSQIAKLFPGTGLLTVNDALRYTSPIRES